MIYITGDCHQDYRRFSSEVFPEGKKLTKDDYVIICGDFGYWTPSPEQEHKLDWLTEKPWTTLFVDGNHECYTTDLPGWMKKEKLEWNRAKHHLGLDEYPVEIWNGGKIHRITDSVFHLMRGQVFTIEDLRIFTFGGASSHDIDDGILNPFDYENRQAFKAEYKRLCNMNAWFRVNQVSWWKREMPSDAEFAEGLENLEKNDWKVDYVVSHCTSTEVQNLYSYGSMRRDKLTEYFQKVQERLDYKKWFFGHYHDNRNVTEKDHLLYEQILRIH